VKETAAALAKQLVASGGQAAAPMATSSPVVSAAAGQMPVSEAAPRRHGESENRAEAVLLSVAGISAPQQQGIAAAGPEAAGMLIWQKRRKGQVVLGVANLVIVLMIVPRIFVTVVRAQIT
jgi:hypothetical protein